MADTNYRDAATGDLDRSTSPHSITRAQLDTAAIAARNEFYGADRGPEATSEWRWVVRAALNAIPGLLDRVREAEAGLDRVAVAMGCGDEVSGYGVYREDVDGMVECARDLRELASDHDECPRPCHCHDDRLAYPVSCEPCKGSGCGWKRVACPRHPGCGGCALARPWCQAC